MLPSSQDKETHGVDTTTDATTPAGSRWSERHPGRAAGRYVVGYLAVAVAGGAIAPGLAGVPPLLAALTVTLIGGVVLLLSLLLVLSICRLRMGPAAEGAGVLALMLVFAVVRPAVFAYVGRAVGAPAAGRHLADALTLLPAPMQSLLGNTILIIWAAVIGRLVSRVIREGKLLLPVAAVASLADIFTVFWGVVAHVTKQAPQVVETFSAAAPVAPPPGVVAPILTAVGIGDFLFFALFLGMAIRYAMRPVATMWATFIAMLLAPIAFLIWPSALGMPGLPFLSAAALWANWRHLEFNCEERRALLFAGLFVLAVAAGLWLLFHR